MLNALLGQAVPSSAALGVEVIECDPATDDVAGGITTRVSLTRVSGTIAQNSVTIGGAAATITAIQNGVPGYVDVTVPVGTAGSKTVAIAGPAGSASKASAFAYTDAGGGGAYILPLTFYRYDGSSGAVLATAGIPLAPAKYASGEVTTNVAVFVDGVEQACYVEVLSGTHSDGSARSLYIEVSYDIVNDTTVGELRIGVARVAATLTKTGPAADPNAIAYPTNYADRAASRIVWPAPPANSAGLPTEIANYLDAYAAAAADRWTFHTTSVLRSGTLYGHILSIYSYWVQSGDPVWWDRGAAIVQAYIAGLDWTTPTFQYSNYAEPTGLLLHYWLSGRAESRTELSLMADTMGTFYYTQWAGGPPATVTSSSNDGNYRPPARALSTLIHAKRAGITTTGGAGAWDVDTQIAEMLAKLLTMQHTDGSFSCGGAWDTGGDQKNFFAGQVATAFMDYLDHVDGTDATVKTAIQNWVDYMVSTATAVAEGGKAWPYTDLASSNCYGDPDQDTWPQLNGVIIPAIAWRYAQLGSVTGATERALLVAAFQGAYVSHTIPAVGQSGQLYWGSPYSADGYLRGFDQSWDHTHQSIGRFVIGETV